MAPRPRVVTNAEGFEIKQRVPFRDRLVFVLVGVLQLLAVGIIAKQLKALGYLPAWVNTDFSSFYKFIPRNAYLVPPCGHLPTRHVLIISENIVFPDGLAPGAVHIKRTKFQSLLHSRGGRSAIQQTAQTVENLGGYVLDVGSAVVSPGLVDIHVHLNEPGRMEWEGITKGTQAAAAGGVTTIVDMPLNNKPVITTPSLLTKKIRRIWEKSRVDMAYWAGLVPQNANNPAELKKLLSMGAVGFKAFMCPSGIEDFPAVTRRDIEAALPVLLAHHKPLMVHAEVVSDIHGTCDEACDVRSHATWAQTRPPEFEVAAARDVVTTLRAVRAAWPDAWRNATSPGSAFGIHIAHLSAVDALPIYAEARAEGLPITIETCSHYLSFVSEEVPPGATQFKCAPPLRDASNRASLLEAVADGTVSVVSSDHSPAPQAMKALESGDFLQAWGGISGLQYSLPALNTIARDRGWSFDKLARLLSSEPAKVAGLAHKKGSIQVGLDADLVIWDPYAAANTSAAGCYNRVKVSPYRDMPLLGRVHATFVRGAMVFSDEKGVYNSRLCGAALTP